VRGSPISTYLCNDLVLLFASCARSEVVADDCHPRRTQRTERDVQQSFVLFGRGPAQEEEEQAKETAGYGNSQNRGDAITQRNLSGPGVAPVGGRDRFEFLLMLKAQLLHLQSEVCILLLQFFDLFRAGVRHRLRNGIL